MCDVYSHESVGRFAGSWAVGGTAPSIENHMTKLEDMVEKLSVTVARAVGKVSIAPLPQTSDLDGGADLSARRVSMVVDGDGRAEIKSQILKNPSKMLDSTTISSFVSLYRNV